ncbi:uncharacterized protein FYW61_021983 [Anableps anableps]
MVVLRCPQKNDAKANILWTNQTGQRMNLANSTSTQSADLSQMDMLLQGHTLVILRASLSHQGNYSCLVRNASNQLRFSLIVYEPQSREYEERNQYSMTCYTQESCTLYCPTVNVPANDTPNITRRGITWHKEDETVSTPNNFPSVAEKDGGIYKCIRSYLYNSQIYNMSFTIILEIQPSKHGKSEILSPQQNDVFLIDLGSTVVIECKAIMYSDFDVVFWLSENSFVDTNESLPVFYNYSRTKYINEINMTASLVFRDVSEEDLLKKYTCKLESDHQQSSFITISLAGKAHPVSTFPVFVVLCTLPIVTVVLIILLLLANHVKMSKFSSVCPMAAKEIYVNAGDLVMLQCEKYKRDGTVMLWKMETDLKRQLYSNMSASEQQQLGLVLYQNSLVILSASLNHQGNYSCSPLSDSEEMPKWMTASLIFKKVSLVNLSKTFTSQPSYMMLTTCTACVVVLMVVIVVVYVEFRIDVTLFLRDKVGFKDCQSSTSDGKSYDAFLMCYKSDTDGGLSEEDRKCLASTLEDQFGYSLCLYDRDVLPGQAVAEAILDCIEHSRAVVLIPSFPDPEPGSGVLSAIHASLVERKTRLIFINTEQTEASRSGSFPEALQLLSKAGNSVTWKGRPPSSSFWKQLRYHLPAPQQTPKMQLLPQEC